jgi:hypothetical protein
MTPLSSRSVPLAIALASAAVLWTSPPALAGTATGESTRGQQAALQKALEQMPAGNTMTTYSCENVVQPMGETLHRCTIQWAPTPP